MRLVVHPQRLVLLMEQPPRKLVRSTVLGLDRGDIEPFSAMNLTDGWHLWVEQWSPDCISPFWKEENVEKDDAGEPDEDSVDAEEERAYEAALASFANDILRDVGREADFEEWHPEGEKWGYQALFWKERPGEDWHNWGLGHDSHYDLVRVVP